MSCPEGGNPIPKRLPAGSSRGASLPAYLATDGRITFGWFAIGPVDPEGDDNQYVDALLLDYGAAPEPERGIAGRLRDYLVRVEPETDDLLLGRAHLAFGSRRIPIAWFVLERLGPARPGGTRR